METNIDLRIKVLKNSASPFENLTSLEKQFAEFSPQNLMEINNWLLDNKFSYLIVTGEQKGADFQVYRRHQEGRYHWRFYIFEDRLIVESHYDNVH